MWHEMWHEMWETEGASPEEEPSLRWGAPMRHGSATRSVP